MAMYTGTRTRFLHRKLKNTTKNIIKICYVNDKHDIHMKKNYVTVVS